MARFLVTGQLRGLPVSVTWNDGEFGGSLPLVESALLVDLGEQVTAKPAGPERAL